jgi:hypothetical protein
MQSNMTSHFTRRFAPLESVRRAYEFTSSGP